LLAASGLSDELKEMKAEREKNKGNEAFRAGDFEEALVYYSRSLSLLKTVAAHNNRAQTRMCQFQLYKYGGEMFSVVEECLWRQFFLKVNIYDVCNASKVR